MRGRSDRGDGATGTSAGSREDARSGIALEALEVGADVGCALVAEIAVAFDRFVDDFF